eukprot:385246_1
MDETARCAELTVPRSIDRCTPWKRGCAAGGHGRPARTFARARVPERGPARTFARALVPARQFARERVPARPRDPEPARVAALVESPPEQVEAQQPALAVEPPGEAPPTAEDPLEPPAHPTTAGCCSS